MVGIPFTLGALLAGGLTASMFSGVVATQALTYFKRFHGDPIGTKMLVAYVWLLDVSHTIFVGVTLWDYLIQHFGDAARADVITWSVPLTILCTAAITLLVHCFFIYRIYKFSKYNLWITIPLLAVACLRLSFACLTTEKMIVLGSLRAFVAQYTWCFSLGLAMSCLVDILITGLLCYMLMEGRKENSSMNHILDSLALYTLKNFALTCTATIVSMICWLTMPTNLIFMGIHFFIGKFYANSLLATLNARTHLQDRWGHFQSSTDRTQPHGFSGTQTADSGSRTILRPLSALSDFPKLTPLQASVERSINMLQTLDPIFMYSQTRPSTANTEQLAIV
ncbi:hypothetical protein BDZ94DRAFT_1261829 [Collybia nuda]|uniref:DUF6534 domain-containing protein n=1 Tax=Collybia nuda TaxID=64659 RepID=A0A9P6CIW2_9AGAR|nr:hypothetical protein BDZ94DRAFT_1261829 [Collybia nuda]